VSEFGSESRLSGLRESVILWRDNDQGATAIEYSLIAAFVSSAIITIIFVLGINVQGLLQSIADLWPA